MLVYPVARAVTCVTVSVQCLDMGAAGPTLHVTAVLCPLAKVAEFCLVEEYIIFLSYGLLLLLLLLLLLRLLLGVLSSFIFLTLNFRCQILSGSSTVTLTLWRLCS